MCIDTACINTMCINISSFRPLHTFAQGYPTLSFSRVVGYTNVYKLQENTKPSACLTFLFSFHLTALTTQQGLPNAEYVGAVRLL